MKKTMFLALIWAAVMLFGACGTLTEIDKIDTEAAKAIALKALNLAGDEVSYAEAVLNERNGQRYYDVKITVDGIDYTLAVDATSGVIIDRSDIAKLYIGEAKAFELAHTAAGHTAEQSTLVFWELHENNGAANYDLWFYGADQGYHYQVDAVTGKILTGVETEIEIPGRNNAVDERITEVIQPPIGSDIVIDLTPVEVEYPKIEVPKSESVKEDFQASTLLKLIQEHGGYERMEIKVIAKFIGASYGELPFHVYFTTPEGKYYHYVISRRTSTILSWESADDLNGLSHPLRNSTAEVILPSDVIPIEEAYGYALRMGIYYDMKTDTLCEPWAEDVLLYVAAPDYNDGEYEYDFIFQEKKTGNFYSITVKADNGAICQFTCGTWSKGYFGAPTDIKSIKMSEYEAKKAVLSCVPAAEESDITAFTTNTEDGKMEYVGTLTYGGMHYTFTIDAYSGAFRSWEATPAK